MATKTVQLERLGTVKLSKRKGTRSIRIAVRGGTIHVTQPTWLPYDAGLRFLRSKADWALEHKEKSAPSYKQGQLIGKTRQLVIEWDAERRSRVTQDLLIVGLQPGEELDNEDTQAYIHSAALRALRKEATDHLPARTKELAAHHGFTYSSIKIKHLKRRWGSCSSTRDIVFNLHLIALEDHHIDYVILHELTHTEHMNHGSDFWHRLEEVYPGARRVAREVRRLQP